MTDRPIEPLPSQRGGSNPTLLAEAVLHHAGDAILGLDRSGTIVLWNNGCESLFGWTAEEMLGQAAQVLVPEGCRDELLRILTALAGRPESAALETQRLHKSGDVLPVSCRVSPVIDDEGNVVGASAIVRDNGREIELRHQLEQARHLAEARFTQSVVAQATLAPDATIIDVNPALCRLSGYEPRQLLGRSVLEFMREDELEVAGSHLEQLADGRLAESEHRRLLKHVDGHFVETRVGIFSVRGDAGEILRLEAVVEDISATAAALRELQIREARWQSLDSNSADVALFCAEDARVLFASGSAKPRFGYDPDQLVGTDGFTFIHPDDEPSVRALWAATVASPRGTTTVFDARVRHGDGSWRWVEESVTNLLGDPSIGAMVVNINDISERKSAEAVLEELAGSDTLTGLATRAPLMAALDAAFASEAVNSTAVAIVDITRLKLINDRHGHLVGDSVLTEVAGRLVATVAGRGVVARVGGDRFAVMVCDIGGPADVFELAEQLRQVFDAPLVAGEHELLLTGTIGAALGPAVDSGALMASAESALTTAKEGLTGPMHVVRAESASTAVSRARLIEDLGRGIADDELVVHFQPVVTILEGRPVAAEALVRWQHPDKGLLSPGAFIGAAEDSGLIVEIGKRVLDAACAAAARWASASHGPHPFHVAVNLSAKQLTSGDVVDVVREVLSKHGAPAHCLVLEVTESAVMAGMDTAVRTLQELRDLGVGIAVDDFGTGYSSLTYLKQFPVTTLKIDRSFVGGLGQNSDDAAIVTSVINLARAMQLDCIAEGVETEQQRLILQALGCTYAQGFLWSPAIDADALDVWLADALRDSSTAGGRTRGAALSRATAVLRSDLRAEPDDVGAQVMARVDELAARGASLHTIAAALNADQLLNGHHKRWTSRSVAVLLAERPEA